VTCRCKHDTASLFRQPGSRAPEQLRFCQVACWRVHSGRSSGTRSVRHEQAESKCPHVIVSLLRIRCRPDVPGFLSRISLVIVRAERIPHGCCVTRSRGGCGRPGSP